MLVLPLIVLAAGQQTVSTLEKAVARNPTAANYRALADAYVRAEKYEQASAAFFKASGLYGRLGDPNAAKVLQTLGERYETKIDIFVERPASRGQARAKLEPDSGCYVGAFIDREDGIDRYFLGNGQRHKDPQDWESAVGRKHAVYFTYLGYGRPFPSQWVSVLKRRGAAAHIAWEPRSIASVRDDSYLRRFARDCRASGVPIFLRFAGEMNGDWTSYHDDPEGYKRMFRTVAKVIHDEASNVAMVWCPNEIPENSIASYYPGADAVDWVGVNFYSVLFNDAERAREAEWRNPADAVRFVYNNYASRHPMMVGEWAATHLSVVDDKPRPDFAVNKIGQFYAAIPRLYPRIKAVNWLSMNTIEHAMPGRKLNDYSILSDSDVAAKYRQMLGSDYYLGEVGRDSPIEFQRVADRSTLSGKVKLSAVVKSYDQRPSVTWSFNGDPSSPKTEPGSYDVSVDLARLKTSQATLAVVVRDAKGRVAGKKELTIQIK